LLKQRAQNPKSAETASKLPDIYISRDDWAKAKEHLGAMTQIMAVELAPASVTSTNGTSLSKVAVSHGCWTRRRRRTAGCRAEVARSE
jgi:hypothetical protein